MNIYDVTGTRKQVNAIGIKESFKMTIKTQTFESARRGAIALNDYNLFEHVEIDSVEYASGDRDSAVLYIDFELIRGVDDLVKVTNDSGNYYFSRDTMRFFKSRVLGDFYKYNNIAYFITSESNFDGSARFYTIRKVDSSLNFDNVGDFQEFKSASGAKKALKRYIKSICPYDIF